MALKIAPKFSFKQKAKKKKKIPQKNTSESNGFCGKSQVNHKKKKKNAKRFISNRELFVSLPLKFKVAFVKRQDVNTLIVLQLAISNPTHLFHVKLFYNRDEIQCDFPLKIFRGCKFNLINSVGSLNDNHMHCKKNRSN